MLSEPSKNHPTKLLTFLEEFDGLVIRDTKELG